MEDASAVDLDWYWRGWFFGTDHVDISIENVKVFTVKSGNPADNKAHQREMRDSQPEELAVQRNREVLKSVVEQDEKMRDFYDTYDEFAADPADEKKYKRKLEGMTVAEKEFIQAEKYYVQVDFKNIGGMIMPLVLKFNFADGTSEIKRVPAEVWSRNNVEVSKVFVLQKDVLSVELDPFLETADCDTSNNSWPAKITPSRFELYNYNRTSRSNPMQK
jgi:hypothetical protein